jgi:hypothetical protein
MGRGVIGSAPGYGGIHLFIARKRGSAPFLTRNHSSNREMGRCGIKKSRQKSRNFHRLFVTAAECLTTLNRLIMLMGRNKLLL